MSVFLPTAALGNSRVLTCFGAKGEVMAFFAPHIDYAQNIRECFPGLWLPERQRFVYCFDGTFQQHQRFLGDTNILETRLCSDELGLTMAFTDLAPVGVPALVRQVRIERDAGRGAEPIRFINYLRLALGECDERNAVHYLPEADVIRQMWRGYTIAIGATEPFAYQCGKVRDSGSQVKHDLEYGWLSGQEQDIGRVDSAIGLDHVLEPGVPWTFQVVFAFAEEEDPAIERCMALRATPFPELSRAVTERCEAWVKPVTETMPERWRGACARALLSIRDLAEESSGAILAAPEFDPTYELSGGYGHCWPRDAAEIVEALMAVGKVEVPRKALEWCVGTQLADGHWYQRYWANGSHAPSWCVYRDFYQLDQTCVTIRSIAEFANVLQGVDRLEYLAATRACVERGVDAMRATLMPDHLHETAADPWEVHRGSFAYTNAALACALLSVEHAYDIPAGDTPGAIKEALLEAFWLEDEGRFARGYNQDRQLDLCLDSSTLGVFDPFPLLDLSVEKERAMASRTLEAIEARLGVQVNGGKAILRFEGESYMGGGPAAVNTLWTARAHLRLAKAELAAGHADAVAPHTEAAERLMHTALAHTTPTGQLPELIPCNGYPYWAAPHGWASGLLVGCVTLLTELADAASRAGAARR